MPGMSLGVDLGTSHVTIYVPGRGIVLREPSVIAVDSKTDRLIACGQEAYDMLGRTPDSIRAVRPLDKGVISEYDYAEQMLRTFVRRVCAYKVLKPRATVSISASSTDVERRSVVEAVLAAGTRKVVLVEEAVAAAVGAGIRIDQPQGSMIVDIGAGTTDIAVLSLKGVANSLSVRTAGNDLDRALVRHIHNQYNHIIGLQTAEQLKREYSSLPDEAADVTMAVKGRDALTGLPRVWNVTSAEVEQALRDPVQEILFAIQRVLETTPPELAGDIMVSGICLAGGGAQLKGLPELVTRYTGVHCYVAPDPTDCVAIGTGKALKFIDLLTSGVYDVSQFSFPLSDSARLE